MANLFNKNNLKDIFQDLVSETSISIPSHINIVSINSNNNITSSFMPQKGGAFSATSSAAGTTGANEVNQLISMLTSETSEINGGNVSTATPELENKLRNMLQSGGANSVDMQKLADLCSTFKSQGIKIKLNDQTASEFFGSEFFQTGGNVDNKSETSELSSVSSSSSDVSVGNVMQTSSSNISSQVGGAKKKAGKRVVQKKKASKKKALKK